MNISESVIGNRKCEATIFEKENRRSKLSETVKRKHSIKSGLKRNTDKSWVKPAIPLSKK